MKILLSLTLAGLTVLGQAAGVKLQRGVLDRGLVAKIACLPGMHSEYNTWQKKQDWLQNPNTYPELHELLSQLGVSGEAFIQAMIEFNQIFPAVWKLSPNMDKYKDEDSENVLPHHHIMQDIAISSHEDSDGKLVELFTRLLEEPQTLMAKAKRRIALLTGIAEQGKDPIYDAAYDPSNLHANMLRANRIGLDWATYMRIVSDDEVSLADFVYMRYVIGKDKKANELFNDLLAKYDLRRADFDEFFAANKDNYADLDKRKDIMDRILSSVLTSTDERKDYEMYDKLGINSAVYVGYVYEGYNLGTWPLANIERHIGTKAKLSTTLDELLADNGVPRAEFEQALDTVFNINSIWWPHSHSNHEMARGNLLYQVAGLGEAALYFNALITKTGNKVSPEQAVRRANILKRMFDTTSPQKSFYYRLNQIGIIADIDRLFFLITVDESVEVKYPEVEEEYPARLYLDDLVNIRHAVDKNQQLDVLFNDLLAEYSLNRDEFEKYFAANKDSPPAGYYFGDGIAFREKLAGAKTSP